MPLLDHFHGQLREERSWETFHSAWAGSLSDDLNRRLPEGYFAEEQTHAGAGVDLDVATRESQTNTATPAATTLALAEPAVYSPPTPARTVPAVFSDDFEVKVFSTRNGPRLVAAIELISPRNKDRAKARQAFAIKCASYLHQGVSLILVDIVTERHANLHEQVMGLLPQSGGSLLPEGTSLYAVAHRPVRREGVEQIDLWASALEVGQPLPTLPLALSGELCLAIDLEATYEDARRRRRL